VRYWAALGDPNESYDTRGSLIANDNLYVLDANILRWYDIISGTWNAYIIGASETPRCISAVGTDIYIGGLSKLWVFDTLTETLTTLDTFTGSIFWAATVGTSVYFAGTFDSLGNRDYGITGFVERQLQTANTLRGFHAEPVNGDVIADVVCHKGVRRHAVVDFDRQ